MPDAALVLAGCLPEDPNDRAEGIAVPTDAVRGVLAELVERRRAESVPDGGA